MASAINKNYWALTRRQWMMREGYVSSCILLNSEEEAQQLLIKDLIENEDAAYALRRLEVDRRGRYSDEAIEIITIEKFRNWFNSLDIQEQLFQIDELTKKSNMVYVICPAIFG